MEMSKQEYQKYVKERAQSSPLVKDCLLAFAIGGGICVAGQLVMDGYTGLELGENPDSAQWDALAQKAAGTALHGGAPVLTGTPAGTKVELGCGLYLVIARGEGLEDYIVTSTDGNGNQKITTTARSGAHTYTFLPSLVSLPGKEGGNTAGEGDWLYDMDVTLKP